jgi:hypothetical protein
VIEDEFSEARWNKAKRLEEARVWGWSIGIEERSRPFPFFLSWHSKIDA